MKEKLQATFNNKFIVNRLPDKGERLQDTIKLVEKAIIILSKNRQGQDKIIQNLVIKEKNVGQKGVLSKSKRSFANDSQLSSLKTQYSDQDIIIKENQASEGDVSNLENSPPRLSKSKRPTNKTTQNVIKKSSKSKSSKKQIILSKLDQIRESPEGSLTPTSSVPQLLSDDIGENNEIVAEAPLSLDRRSENKIDQELEGELSTEPEFTALQDDTTSENVSHISSTTLSISSTIDSSLKNEVELDFTINDLGKEQSVLLAPLPSRGKEISSSEENTPSTTCTRETSKTNKVCFTNESSTQSNRGSQVSSISSLEISESLPELSESDINSEQSEDNQNNKELDLSKFHDNKNLESSNLLNENYSDDDLDSIEEMEREIKETEETGSSIYWKMVCAITIVVILEYILDQYTEVYVYVVSHLSDQSNHLPHSEATVETVTSDGLDTFTLENSSTSTEINSMKREKSESPELQSSLTDEKNFKSPSPPKYQDPLALLIQKNQKQISQTKNSSNSDPRSNSSASSNSSTSPTSSTSKSQQRFTIKKNTNVGFRPVLPKKPIRQIKEISFEEVSEVFSKMRISRENNFKSFEGDLTKLGSDGGSKSYRAWEGENQVKFLGVHKGYA